MYVNKNMSDWIKTHIQTYKFTYMKHLYIWQCVHVFSSQQQKPQEHNNKSGI